MNFHAPKQNVPSVLVLDDDAHFRVLLSSLIKTTGVNVFEARSARDADQVLLEQRPSLAIVDYRLPGMDGMEWITKIREEGNQIPLVFLTGTWCDAKTFNRLRSLLRVSLILQKPIVPDLFLEQIEFLLPQLQGQAAFEEAAPSNQNGYCSQDEQGEPAVDDSESCEEIKEDSYEVLKAEREPNLLIEEAPQLEEAAAETHRVQAEAENQIAVSATETNEVNAAERPQDIGSIGSGDSEAVASGGPKSSGTRMPALRPSNTPYGKDAMRMSNSGMPPFATDRAEQSVAGETRPEFEKIPLSRNDQMETSIIRGEESVVSEQLVASRQKIDVERALKVARAAYARSLPEKVEELAKAVADFKADCFNSAKLDEVAQLAHRFKGTAGSLGFPEVGKAAANIEQFLLAGTTGDAGLDDNLWRRIENSVKLCAEIAESSAILSQASSAGKSDSALRRVLLVGPYESFAGLSKELARKEIGESQLVDDLPAAVAFCTKQRFDCALIDMSHMSFENALTEIKKARQNQFFRALPFAFVTENEWPDDCVLYLGAEFNLINNYDPVSVSIAVESLLALHDTTKARVLTIDDDVVLTGFISGTLLSQGLAVHALNEPNLVLEALEEFEPDLVLVDVVMPGVSGYDICRLMRSTERFHMLPIIFLTSKSSPEGRAAAFRAGGNDLIAKPILTEELLSRVRSRLEVSQALKERAGVNERSGLISRIAFLNSVTKFIEAAQLHGATFSLALLSVEGFQEIALSNGFAAQDKLFQELTAIVQARFRLGDIRAQWSDGCIAVSLFGHDHATAAAAMQYLQEEFGRRSAEIGDSASKNRRIRFGVAELLIDGVTAESLVECAYQRLMVGQ
jgi:PleD family two-component response regulator/HPt (histidine-containing phosphotransfer) domain-containing protein